MYKLLIVDDEPLTREYMKRNVSLIDSRWEVVGEAMEGREALDLLKIIEADLVITDIKMPVMDGLELSKEIYENYSNIRVVILSGYEEFDFAKEAIKYRVKDYLLKPLVKSDLKGVLNIIATDLENSKNNELAFNAMASLSEESKKLVIKNFLRAIISEANVEIKTIYPILFKLKISLIEAEGSIMLLKVNEDSILNNSINFDEMPLFKFILSQVANEVSENYKNIYVFLDKDENTVVLVDIENKNDYIDECRKLYSQIAKEYNKKTGLIITCGIGEPENEVLQLGISYEKASYALEGGFIFGNENFYSYEKVKATFKDELECIRAILPSIQSGVLDNNKLQYSLSLTKYVDSIKNPNSNTIFRFGIYLINSIKSYLPNVSQEQINEAFIQLKTMVVSSHGELTKENMLTIMNNLLQLIVNKSFGVNDCLNENDIVNRAKNYIYAHYNEPISLVLIAEKTSVSVSYLSSIFHKNVGEPYIKFLTKVRMEEAAKLLRKDTNIKIYDVAEKVGYVSVKHFSYIFKNYFNITPGEYLERS